MSDSLVFLLVGGVIGAILGAIGAWIKAGASRKSALARVSRAALMEKQALQEEIARQKRADFLTLQETFTSGVATLDTEGRILRHNRALKERIGHEDEDLKDCSICTLVHPQDVANLQEFLRGLVGLRAGSPNLPHFSQEVRLYSQSGELLWMQLSLSVLHDPDLYAGSPFLVLAMFDDITRRHRAEGVAARLQAGVHDLYRVIADQESDFNSQMKALLALGCRLFGVSTGLLGKFAEGQLEIMDVVSSDARLRIGRVYDVGRHLANARRLELPTAVRRSEILDWRDRPFYAVTDDETFVGAPVYVAGRLSGILSFSDPEPRGAAFESEQTQFCQLMALWVGAEIERRHRQSQREQEGAALAQANARLTTLATQDGLTGLKNRRAFDEQLKEQSKHARNSTMSLSLMLMDVDKFKHFNDTFGHPAGDEVLKRVARLIESAVRAEGFVARYGGEEFVVLLPDTDTEAALVIAERVRCRIEGGDWSLRAITASIGVSTWTPDMTTTQQLLDTADNALYQSKELGRNRVTLGKFAESKTPQSI